MSMTIHYRPIPTEFRENGFDLKQLMREGDVAIYQKSNETGYAGFEVVRIRNRDEYTIKGKVIPPAESYPSNEQWGSLGFSYAYLSNAQKRMRKMLEEKK